MPDRFTTEGTPGRKRLSLWQDIVCDVFVQLDCKSDLDSGFHGAVTRAAFGQAAFSEVSSCRERVYRTPSRIARADEHYLLIALGRSGQGGVVQDGREALIRPGEFAFYDTTRPYELLFDDDFAQTIFQIPRDMISRLSGTENLTATAFNSTRPLDKLALDFIAAIRELADRVDADTANRLTEQAIDLVAMAINERLAGRTVAKTTHRSALLLRLKTHLHGRMRDPELSLSAVASALSVSPRYVNDLFADESTSFQRYVLSQRLERCARDLASAQHAHRQIGEIAFGWGFNDLSHFSRVFRERYGLSPRQWRHDRRADGMRPDATRRAGDSR